MKAGTMYDVASYSDADWSRLGEAIRRRRVALNLTQDELADAAPCSVNTIRNLEQGKRARHLTLPKINKALGWVEDSYILVLDGQLPIVEESQEPDADALRFDRPDNISDAAWEEIRDDLVRDFEKYLRYRRGR